MEKAVNLIRAVASTLDGVEVKGHENWDRMLGCYNALTELADSLTAQADVSAKAPEKEDEDG